MKSFARVSGIVLSCASLCHAADLKSIDTQTMLGVFYEAGSRADTDAPGGYATSANYPEALGKNPFGINGEISLLALTNDVRAFNTTNVGFRVVLVNRTDHEVSLDASDSCIFLFQEALDRDGKWRRIEYLPPSFCGNSYHSVFLPTNHYWAFIVPTYSGTFKTRLRFVLRDKQPIYSNEFDGRINPAQFNEPPPPRFQKAIDKNSQPKLAHPPAKHSPEESAVLDRINLKWDALMREVVTTAPSRVMLTVNLDEHGKVASIDVKKSTAPKDLVEICKRAVQQSAPFDLKGQTSFDITFNYEQP